MKVVAIVNPIAGAGSKGATFHQLPELARQAGVRIECLRTRGAGHARQIANEWASRASSGDPVRALIAVGGDGTIHEVADGLAGSSLPLVAWPTGTENLFAKSFGFRACPESTLDCLRNGTVRAIDLGQANGRTFLIVAGMGFDAEVVHRLVRARTGHITHLTYSAPLWRTFWEHRFPRFRVYGEEALIWEGRGMVFVGNMPRYSLGLRVIRDALCTDGLLDLCILPCHGRLGLLAHSLRTIFRRHIGHGGVQYLRARCLRVESDDPVFVELDGEAAGSLPLSLSVLPGALRVLVPPGRTKR